MEATVQNRKTVDLEQEFDRVFAKQQAHKRFMAQTTASERRARLKRLHDWTMENSERIRDAIFSISILQVAEEITIFEK